MLLNATWNETFCQQTAQSDVFTWTCKTGNVHTKLRTFKTEINLSTSKQKMKH